MVACAGCSGIFVTARGGPSEGMTSLSVLIFCVACDDISDVVSGGHKEEDESVTFVGFFVSLPFSTGFKLLMFCSDASQLSTHSL